MDLVSVEELIKILKENNINFGKGDPYNRLRYYTKIGLIPHMTRKKNSNNTNSGHYPKEIISKIIEIEKLKDSGLSNEEIIDKFKATTSENKIDYIQFIKDKITVNHLFISLLVLGCIFEIYRANLQIPNDLDIKNETAMEKHLVVETGINFISSGQKKVFVPSKQVKQDSNINLSFRGNIFPATHYFISDIKEGLGFIVETNIEVNSEIKFTWNIIN
jgi:DNA-binding transcriptional MerR regulator